MIKCIISLKNDICDEHSTFFFYNGTFITESLHKRLNQSLASIHWLTYKPTVFDGGWFISLVLGVCVYDRRSQPVRQAACGL